MKRLMLAFIFFSIFYSDLTEASANCTSMSISQIQPMVQSFLIRPLSLLERNPSGGRNLSETVGTVLAGDDQATLAAVMSLIGNSNFDQKRAIALGILAAIDQCDRNRPDAARRIRKAVASKADPIVNGTMTVPAGPTDTASGVVQAGKKGVRFDPFATMPLPGTKR